MAPGMLPVMGDQQTAAQWAIGAAIKFREVERTSENPTTVALAEGLACLAEAIRTMNS